MLPLSLDRADAAPLNLLVLGAHSDDPEIGCGGTVLKLIADGAITSICWVVLSGTRLRAGGTGPRRGLLHDAPNKQILQPGFCDEC